MNFKVILAQIQHAHDMGIVHSCSWKAAILCQQNTTHPLTGRIAIADCVALSGSKILDNAYLAKMP